MTRIISMLILSTLSFWTYSAEFEKPNVELDQKKLLAGKLQTFISDYKLPGKDVEKRALGIILINAPIDRVWEVIEDWPAMGEYVPNLEYYKVVHEKINSEILTKRVIAGKIKVPLINVQYTMDVEFDKEHYTVSWDLLSDERAKQYKQQGVNVVEASTGLKAVEGFSLMESLGENQTVYYYSPIIEVSLPVPSFAENYMSKVTLAGYMKAIKNRSEKYLNN